MLNFPTLLLLPRLRLHTHSTLPNSAQHRLSDDGGSFVLCIRAISKKPKNKRKKTCRREWEICTKKQTSFSLFLFCHRYSSDSVGARTCVCMCVWAQLGRRSSYTSTSYCCYALQIEYRKISLFSLVKNFSYFFSLGARAWSCWTSGKSYCR